MLRHQDSKPRTSEPARKARAFWWLTLRLTCIYLAVTGAVASFSHSLPGLGQARGIVPRPATAPHGGDHRPATPSPARFGVKGARAVG